MPLPAQRDEEGWEAGSDVSCRNPFKESHVGDADWLSFIFTYRPNFISFCLLIFLAVAVGPVCSFKVWLVYLWRQHLINAFFISKMPRCRFSSCNVFTFISMHLNDSWFPNKMNHNLVLQSIHVSVSIGCWALTGRISRPEWLQSSMHFNWLLSQLKVWECWLTGHVLGSTAVFSHSVLPSVTCPHTVHVYCLLDVCLHLLGMLFYQLLTLKPNEPITLQQWQVIYYLNFQKNDGQKSAVTIF